MNQWTRNKLVGILALGAVGAMVLASTVAADTTAGTARGMTDPGHSDRGGVLVQAEQAGVRSVGGTDGPAWNIWANGHIQERVRFRGTSQTLTVRARGNSSSGRAPMMELSVDGTVVGRTEVQVSSNWKFKNYRFLIDVSPGEHDVRVAFVNDSNDAGENLDLVVDWFGIRPSDPDTTNPNTTNPNTTRPADPSTTEPTTTPPQTEPPTTAAPTTTISEPTTTFGPSTTLEPTTTLGPTTTAAPPPSPGNRSPHVPAGYSLTWNDEFDSLSLDVDGDGGERWATNWLRWNVLSLAGNGDQCMKAHPNHTGTGGPRLGLETHRVDDGVLTLFGRPIPQNRRSQFWGYEAVCGMITGEKSHAQTYGYWETRMRIPNVSRGHHWAIWLLPENGTWPPEVDVLEVVGSNGSRNTDERRFHFTGHYNDANGAKQADMSFRDAPRAADDWYTLGLEWTSDSVIWYLDGLEVHRMGNFIGTDPNYFLISPEIGGNWPGPTDRSTRWPMSMEVDYVRIYSK